MAHTECAPNLVISSLHKQPELLDAACSLLNSEWKRGESARKHSIRRSSDSLPCSLLLLHGTDVVVGFARISSVMGITDAILVESVVVDKARRGQGLGRALMDAVEGFGRAHYYSMVYLSTHDKEGFYAHLGYSHCGPVSIQPASARGMSADQVSNLSSLFGVLAASPPEATQDACSAKVDVGAVSKAVSETEEAELCKDTAYSDACCASISVLPPGLPPPPPPPPCPPSIRPTVAKEPDLPIIWMRKAIT